MILPTLRSKIELAPYQATVCQETSAAIASGHRRPLIVMRTAAGKTVVAAELVAQAARRKESVLFVVHSNELIKQTSARFLEYDPDALGDHGYIKAGMPTRLMAKIQVASVQTLHARAFRTKRLDLNRFDMIIIDEAHHARASTYQQIVNAYPEAVIVGLTATPCRGDGRGLGNIFDCIILGPSFHELEAAGRLVKSRIFAPHRPDLKGVRISSTKDYDERQLAMRMDKGELVGDIVTHWIRHGENRQTVVFATGVAHSIHIRDEFRKQDIPAEHIDGETPKEERDEILRKLKDGETKVVSNCMVLTEGWDQPGVSCLILARPTKRIGMYLQMSGRVLRSAPGKTDAVILDHSGAVFEHGFPEDDIEWTLESDDKAVNKTKSEILSGGRQRTLTTCPQCSAVRMEGEACPACGWRFQPKPKQIEFANGDLSAVDRSRRQTQAQADNATKLRFYRELKWIAAKYGHKPGVAYYRFIEKFGSKPDLGWNNTTPVPASPETQAWYRSRTIAYAKSNPSPRERYNASTKPNL